MKWAMQDDEMRHWDGIKVVTASFQVPLAFLPRRRSY
jgi:hypothetical protein